MHTALATLPGPGRPGQAGAHLKVAGAGRPAGPGSTWRWPEPAVHIWRRLRVSEAGRPAGLIWRGPSGAGAGPHAPIRHPAPSGAVRVEPGVSIEQATAQSQAPQPLTAASAQPTRGRHPYHLSLSPRRPYPSGRRGYKAHSDGLGPVGSGPAPARTSIP